jgi:hypothetical protein
MSDTYYQAGDWVVGTARRNPEALLLLAAGCVLLMRSGGGRKGVPRRDHDQFPRPDLSGRPHEGLSGAAEKAADYAGDIKERVSDAAGSYAGTVSEFAQDAGRTVADGSQRMLWQTGSAMQAGMDRVLRDQPLAVAIVGLAAGAAVAAAFPATAIENRALGGAHEALTEAATKAGRTVMTAAGKAGESLKSAAEERGLTSGSLKDLANEVADTFTDAVAGKSEDHRGATIVPDKPAPPKSFGGTSGADPGKSNPVGDSSRTTADAGLGGGSRR